MITKEDLESAIKECEGQRSPNASTALKLAAFYTIKRELYPEDNQTIEKGYSYDPPPESGQNTIDFDSSTEFGEIVNGKDIRRVLTVIDDILSNVYVIDPSLYRKIIRSLSEV